MSVSSDGMESFALSGHRLQVIACAQRCRDGIICIWAA